MDDNALLLSDNEVVTQPKSHPKSPVAKDGPVPKQQRLSLAPTSSATGGFDTSLMASIVAKALKDMLPQAVSQHYNL